MAPLNTLTHHSVNTILISLHKRDADCTYYDASCSYHRLAILIIIIAIGIIASAILSLLYVRSRRSKAAKMRASMQQRPKANAPWENYSAPAAYTSPTTDSAPPPYEPRRPERAARAAAEWR
ncbi:hypothetical protein HBI56_004320 [Parastagonospora nodorum]|uniref:Uncharacterized protein n=2 Tax=Phaeosphaeria nodorum (strain SN15 / ATCC MYA-4574 / FGSC 10173) TaxID=321614 RepID=Q0V5D1_PHANO|nr:hypothetical protein SNOG_00783 [Parastagonospora nodorum SN15]KAH3910818.1 hypothetical protein HBH56_136730 [Parastagonospora nodorum]EAT92278.1 hypothetical protein SNOG_00783 [Parastagonospora nodorum SN15]KAH3927956.1 hypothetical protein HBH54_141860 [Parastagonospora nodorum]KAH3949024.1 hypothetical protein HBH53_091840 [Parastagonospora nodorum]KAH3972477.1 hypothetical protein HBH52_153360 [Parastagonospora nodorum]